jgi:hypothetical protein
VGARFYAPVQTGAGAHSAFCTIGTGSSQGVKSGRGLTLTSHPLTVPLVMKEYNYTSTPLWAIRSVQSLSACTRVHFTWYLYCWLYLFINSNVAKNTICNIFGLAHVLMITSADNTFFQKRIHTPYNMCGIFHYIY